MITPNTKLNSDSNSFIQCVIDYGSYAKNEIMLMQNTDNGCYTNIVVHTAFAFDIDDLEHYQP